MSYLSVAQNIQSRAQTYSGKLALQRYVELVETGISEGGLEPAIARAPELGKAQSRPTETDPKAPGATWEAWSVGPSSEMSPAGRLQLRGPAEACISQIEAAKQIWEYSFYLIWKTKY